MAQVITAAQQKGGTGKSTMIAALGAYMAADGAKTLIIDTDPQKSCVDWAETEDIANLDVLEHLSEDQLIDVIEKAGPQYDVILIDTAGYDSRMATYAIQSSDLVLIPTRGSSKDVMGAARTWKHATALTRKYKNPPAFQIVFWNIRKDTRVFQHAKTELRKHGLPVLDYALPSLTGFEIMSWNGGMPTGRAKGAFGSFMGALQLSDTLDFYREDKAVANG
jgi:chromosome partitioning protein